jgi:NADH dehydrogenase, FAD-containing subunit
MARFLVAGTGAAGVSCAMKLSRNHRVFLCGDRNRTYYPALTEATRGKPEATELDIEELVSDTNVEFVEGTPEGTEDGYVSVGDTDIEYDQLVSAPPLKPFEPDFSLKYAIDMYDPAQTEKASRIEGESACIIGAGKKGVETAFVLAENGCDVRLVEASTRPLPGHREDVSEGILKRLRSAGIDFSGGKEVKHITNYGLELSSGGEIESENVLWCGGMEHEDYRLDHDIEVETASGKDLFRQQERAGLKAQPR